MKFKVLWIAGLVLAATAGQVQAGFVKSYDFDGGLSDTLGNGSDLIASGGSVSGGRYHFTDNQGLRLDSAVSDTSNYGVEFRVRFDDDGGGYNKLLDFQNLDSDDGIYVLEGTPLFWPEASGGSVTVGTDFTIGLERKVVGALETVNVFLDNVMVFSFDDTTEKRAVSIGNILNFFVDDTASGQGESFAGSVDFIRIYDDASTFGASSSAVPEPASIAMWGFGAIGMMFAGRKRSKRN